MLWSSYMNFNLECCAAVQSLYNTIFKSIGMDCVISESCYNGKILHKNYRKMTFPWSFSCNSFVKFCGKNIWEPQYEHVISKSEMCYKGIALYFYLCFSRPIFSFSSPQHKILSTKYSEVRYCDQSLSAILCILSCA